MKEGIPTIAFEGINRVGKGTQIEKLKDALNDTGISFLELRGDGTREGLGEKEGDPFDEWWQENSKKLRAQGTTEEWNRAAYKLALELCNWKKVVYELGKEIILLDRSLISRASFIIDRESTPFTLLEIKDLYPEQPEQKLDLEDILPDLIIELVAPREVLLSRLDPNDPKYDFRSRIIESNYANFLRAKKLLPNSIGERIVTIDSSRPIDVVFDDVLETLNDKLAMRKRITKPSA